MIWHNLNHLFKINLFRTVQYVATNVNPFHTYYIFYFFFKKIESIFCFILTMTRVF